MHKYSGQIEIRTRGIIFKDDEILVLKEKGKDYYHFPGGHAEFGEQLTKALTRELEEELVLKIKSYKLIGVVDNIYNTPDGNHHEINFVFHVEAENIQDKSNESKLEVVFMNPEEFFSERVLPFSIRNSIIQWKKDKKFFWVTDDIDDKIIKH